MSDVQLENGYTRIANAIIDHIMTLSLNGTQHSIIYCVTRYTYGFQRKSHGLSLTFISEATGIHKDQIKRELSKLISLKVIKVYKEPSFNSEREIGINKNINEWEVTCRQNRPEGTKKSTGSENTSPQGAIESTPTGDGLVPQERKSFKESSSNSDSSIGPFEIYQDEFGMIGPTTVELIGELIDTYGERWTVEAMKNAIKQGKRKLSYVEGTLVRWRSDGVDEPWNNRASKQGVVVPYKKSKEDVFREFISGGD